MFKKMNKIIEIPCEESEKEEIVSRICDYLVDDEDYNNGDIAVKSDRFGAVDVIIYDGCKNIHELTKILTL